MTAVPPVSQSQNKSFEAKMEKDSPPDTFHYTRRAIPEDFAPGGRPALPTSTALRQLNRVQLLLSEKRALIED